MRIQHNIAAMNSYRNYNINNKSLNKNLEKLSSGYKINRAGDDAAGLAISEKMRAQISGLEQATSNAKDGISLIQTAEGALTEVHDMLNRMYKLAEQSANGTYDENDRNKLNEEVSQLMDEIDRISKTANFNGMKLFGEGDAQTTPESIADAAVIGLQFTELPANFAQIIGAGSDLVEVAQGNDVTADIFNGMVDGGADSSGNINLEFTVAMDSGNATVSIDNLADDYSVEVTSDLSSNKSGTLNNVATNATAHVTVKYNGGDEDVEVATFDIKLGTGSGDGTVKFTAKVQSTTDADTTVTPMTASGITYGSGVSGTVKTAYNSAVEQADNPPDLGPEGYTADRTALTGVSVTGATATLEDSTTAKTQLAKLSTATVTMTIAKSGNSIESGATVTFALTATAASDATLPSSLTVGNAAYVAAGTSTAAALSGSFGNGANSVKTKLGGATVTADIKASGVKIGTVTFTMASTGTIASGANSVTFKINPPAENPLVSVGSNLEEVTSDVAKVTKTNRPINAKKAPGTSTITSTAKTYNNDAKTFSFAIGEVSSKYSSGTGANKQFDNILTISYGYVDCNSLGIGNIDIRTAENAQKSLDLISEAINNVSSVRGRLGAYQNRLEHTINNLGAMRENIQDAESTIRDTDVAEEMMAYTKNSILNQAAQAMLAQANQQPQGVLQLLG